MPERILPNLKQYNHHFIINFIFKVNSFEKQYSGWIHMKAESGPHKNNLIYSHHTLKSLDRRDAFIYAMRDKS